MLLDWFFGLSKNIGSRSKILNDCPFYTVTLMGRHQCVKLMVRCDSSWEQVSSGVPQGSILGPLLFVLYFNELLSLVSSKLFMLADDIKLYHTMRSPKDCLTLQWDIIL